jgi:hypothetical protein
MAQFLDTLPGNPDQRALAEERCAIVAMAATGDAGALASHFTVKTLPRRAIPSP